MRDLTIEGKIVIFKSLAIPKVEHLALIKSVPIFTVEQLNIIKRNFIWQGKKTKIMFFQKHRLSVHLKICVLELRLEL